MKTLFYLFFFLGLQFSFNFQLSEIFHINSKYQEESLLIFFIKEQNEALAEGLSDEDYMKKLMFRELYSTFNVGLPNQNIKFYYEMNEVESSVSKEYYFPKRSTAYKLREDNIYSQEMFVLGENKNIDNFTFILKEKSDSTKTKNYNSLGLGYKKNDAYFNFLSQLKNKGYIKKKIFSFLFGDDSLSESRVFDGQLLFGNYPHFISPYFNENELKFTSLKEKEKWIIEFDSVKFNNDELDNKIAKLDVNLNVMIGPETFRKELISSFLYEAIDNGKCKENFFTSDKDGQTYIFYSFDNNIKFKEIPNLFFFSKDLNETFKIKFSDLVTKYNQKYYFNIIFNKKPKNEWVLGQKFINNYKFVFDLEEGKIGYYKTYNGNNRFVLFSCLILFGTIFGIGYIRGYINRKNMAQRNNNKQIPYVIRKEYSQAPEEEKEINKNKNLNKNNENENKIEDKLKKD